jgi:MFS superfamily sulfate permease-like transporter
VLDARVAKTKGADQYNAAVQQIYIRRWFTMGLAHGAPTSAGDLLAGLVVALALIPEAIAFSIIAGVDPKVGLYASFCIAVIIAFTGGRPGMISAATGAMALVMVLLVKEHGLQYLLAATVLTGVLQIVAGCCGWAR